MTSIPLDKVHIVLPNSPSFSFLIFPGFTDFSSISFSATAVCAGASISAFSTDARISSISLSAGLVIPSFSGALTITTILSCVRSSGIEALTSSRVITSAQRFTASSMSAGSMYGSPCRKFPMYSCTNSAFCLESARSAAFSYDFSKFVFARENSSSVNPYLFAFSSSVINASNAGANSPSLLIANAVNASQVYAKG